MLLSTPEHLKKFCASEKKRLNKLYSSQKVNRIIEQYENYYSKGWVHPHRPGDSMHYVSLAFNEIDEDAFNLGKLSWGCALLVCYRALTRFNSEDFLSEVIKDIYGEEVAKEHSMEALEETDGPFIISPPEVPLSVAVRGLRLNAIAQVHDCIEAHIKKNRSNFIEATVQEWVSKENTPRLRRAI